MAKESGAGISCVSNADGIECLVEALEFWSDIISSETGGTADSFSSASCLFKSATS